MVWVKFYLFHNIFLIILLTCLFEPCCSTETLPMPKEERQELKEEARDMFYHAYRAYMENAYPADELMPLSCSGRYRGLGPSRGDIDDAMGNFSLTLVDTLDTLVILGDFEEFEHGVKLVIRDVTFDHDIVVSVFETNIRMLGGLLSAHILAEYLQQRAGIMPWYKGELLNMAKDLGYRLLPAFNTTTGIPYARINLRHGIKNDKLESFRETCTACAGTIILEMAALSRLTGEPIFEEKAQRAMDELWKMRHRSSDLMGTVLNVHSGDWIRRDSGVGAGIDSYYEYCLKAYILLGDDKYLTRFNRHYSAVMKYISQGPMLLDVHMHRPHTNSRNYMDALLAFWPGLQVLKGDIKPAVETHEMLYQVMQRHNFIPEAFTTDFQVHWGQHPLRPEFLESTYFLYTATNDPYYLQVGKNVLKSLQKYARVPCGYAAVNDVRTGKHEDRMDSFVLAETFKYLFLLFADPEELVLDLDEFLFTTEAHLLPLTLASHSNSSKLHLDDEDLDDSEFSRSCPNSLHLFPESVRKPLKNMVDGVCPRRLAKRRLTAAEFQVSNVNHLKIIKDMGINIIALNDGRIQLLHTFSSARSPSDAEEGLLFMQEMVELSKVQSQQPDALPQAVSFVMRDSTGIERKMVVRAGPSHFGPELQGDTKITGPVVFAQPFRVCSELQNIERIKGRIAIMERGDCMFVEKARKIQKAGAVAGIVIDNTPGSSSATSPMFAMSGDGNDDIKIPVVFLFAQDANKLLLALTYNPMTEITLSEYKSDKSGIPSSSEESMFQKLKVSVQDFLTKHTGHTFTKTVTVKDLTATISQDQIEINQTPSEENIVTETLYTQWRIVRIGLFTLMGNNNKEFVIPTSVLQIYYRTLSGTSEEDIINSDLVVQTKWLLNELSNELNKNKITTVSENSDKEIIDLVPNKEVLLELLNFKGTSSKIRLEKIHSLLESINELEKTIIKELERRGNDDLIVSEERNNNVITEIIEDRTDKTSEKGDEIITKRSVISKDEL